MHRITNADPLMGLKRGPGVVGAFIQMLVDFVNSNINGDLFGSQTTIHLGIETDGCTTF